MAWILPFSVALGIGGMSYESRGADEAAPLEGRYANFFKIGHNAVEFVLDFGQFYSESGDAQLNTRIVTSPTYAKALLKLLDESIAEYEGSFGAIREQT